MPGKLPEPLGTATHYGIPIIDGACQTRRMGWAQWLAIFIGGICMLAIIALTAVMLYGMATGQIGP